MTTPPATTPTLSISLNALSHFAKESPYQLGQLHKIARAIGDIVTAGGTTPSQHQGTLHHQDLILSNPTINTISHSLVDLCTQLNHSDLDVNCSPSFLNNHKHHNLNQILQSIVLNPLLADNFLISSIQSHYQPLYIIQLLHQSMVQVFLRLLGVHRRSPSSLRENEITPPYPIHSFTVPPNQSIIWDSTIEESILQSKQSQIPSNQVNEHISSDIARSSFLASISLQLNLPDNFIYSHAVLPNHIHQYIISTLLKCINTIIDSTITPNPTHPPHMNIIILQYLLQSVGPYLNLSQLYDLGQKIHFSNKQISGNYQTIIEILYLSILRPYIEVCRPLYTNSIISIDRQDEISSNDHDLFNLVVQHSSTFSLTNRSPPLHPKFLKIIQQFVITYQIFVVKCRDSISSIQVVDSIPFDHHVSLSPLFITFTTQTLPILTQRLLSNIISTITSTNHDIVPDEMFINIFHHFLHTLCQINVNNLSIDSSNTVQFPTTLTKNINNIATQLYNHFFTQKFCVQLIILLLTNHNQITKLLISTNHLEIDSDETEVDASHTAMNSSSLFSQLCLTVVSWAQSNGVVFTIGFILELIRGVAYTITTANTEQIISPFPFETIIDLYYYIEPILNSTTTCLRANILFPNSATGKQLDSYPLTILHNELLPVERRHETFLSKHLPIDQRYSILHNPSVTKKIGSSYQEYKNEQVPLSRSSFAHQHGFYLESHKIPPSCTEEYISSRKHCSSSPIASPPSSFSSSSTHRMIYSGPRRRHHDYNPTPSTFIRCYTTTIKCNNFALLTHFLSSFEINELLNAKGWSTLDLSSVDGNLIDEHQKNELTLYQNTISFHRQDQNNDSVIIAPDFDGDIPTENNDLFGFNDLLNINIVSNNNNTIHRYNDQDDLLVSFLCILVEFLSSQSQYQFPLPLQDFIEPYLISSLPHPHQVMPNKPIHSPFQHHSLILPSQLFTSVPALLVSSFKTEKSISNNNNNNNPINSGLNPNGEVQYGRKLNLFEHFRILSQCAILHSYHSSQGSTLSSSTLYYPRYGSSGCDLISDLTRERSIIPEILHNVKYDFGVPIQTFEKRMLFDSFSFPNSSRSITSNLYTTFFFQFFLSHSHIIPLDTVNIKLLEDQLLQMRTACHFNKYKHDKDLNLTDPNPAHLSSSTLSKTKPLAMFIPSTTINRKTVQYLVDLGGDITVPTTTVSPLRSHVNRKSGLLQIFMSCVGPELSYSYCTITTHDLYRSAKNQQDKMQESGQYKTILSNNNPNYTINRGQQEYLPLKPLDIKRVYPTTNDQYEIFFSGLFHDLPIIHHLNSLQQLNPRNYQTNSYSTSVPFDTQQVTTLIDYWEDYRSIWDLLLVLPPNQIDLTLCDRNGLPPLARLLQQRVPATLKLVITKAFIRHFEEKKNFFKQLSLTPPLPGYQTILESNPQYLNYIRYLHDMDNYPTIHPLIIGSHPKQTSLHQAVLISDKPPKGISPYALISRDLFNTSGTNTDPGAISGNNFNFTLTKSLPHSITTLVCLDTEYKEGYFGYELTARWSSNHPIGQFLSTSPSQSMELAQLHTILLGMEVIPHNSSYLTTKTQIALLSSLFHPIGHVYNRSFINSSMKNIDPKVLLNTRFFEHGKKSTTSICQYCLPETFDQIIFDQKQEDISTSDKVNSPTWSQLYEHCQECTCEGASSSSLSSSSSSSSSEEEEGEEKLFNIGAKKSPLLSFPRFGHTILHYVLTKVAFGNGHRDIETRERMSVPQNLIPLVNGRMREESVLHVGMNSRDWDYSAYHSDMFTLLMEHITEAMSNIFA